MITGALVASRFLLWDSVRGAKLFEQTQANPMREVAAHFRWLLCSSDKPIAFFVDDLDRRQRLYVADFLDTVQTLIRDSPARVDAEKLPGSIFHRGGRWSMAAEEL